MDSLTHVAFLRGINVGGHRVTNPELTAVFDEIGFASAVPYQAAGNVMLACDGDPDVESIEAALAARLGFDVPTIVRSAREVREIAAVEPFEAALVRGSLGKVQVLLLAGSCTPEQVEPFSSDHDRLVAAGSEIYLLPAEGMSKTQLDTTGLESAVGTFTVRTQGTIARLTRKLT